METTWWTQPSDLDPAQRAVVSLPFEGSHLVIGPPGSGKTNLLILRATFLYRAGLKNISVITLGRILREFLSAGSGNYDFPPAQIQTYVRWGAQLLTTHGISFQPKGKRFPVIRAELLKGLQQLANMQGTKGYFDCVLIDEAQDYTPEEIAVIRHFAKEIFAAGDDKQRIYDVTGGIEYLKTLVQSESPLPNHYRNGIRICRVADGILNTVGLEDSFEASSKYDERRYPSTVQSWGEITLPEQVAAAAEEIATQLRAYPDGMIGCLCPRHKELDAVWQELQSSDIREHAQLQVINEYGSLDPSKRVIVATTHGAKGLEFRALHLLAFDKVANFQNTQVRLAYTAVTRAKTSLTIYHDAALPGYVNRGLSAANPPDIRAPSFDSLFKGGL